MTTLKETKVKDIDITKSGPMTFSQLRDANNDPFASVRPQTISLYDINRHAPQMVSSSLAGTTTPWGESMFDEATATEEQFQNLGDIRAENQPWYAKIGAGLAKGVVLAGTTFLNGPVGLAIGIGTAIGERRWSGIWDNFLTNAMADVNEWSEEVMPNYYTQDEIDHPWSNVFTSANFWGDKLIKNIGFFIGAAYGGGAISKGIRGIGKLIAIGAKRAGASISTVKNILEGSSIAAGRIATVTSSVAEGSIEALNGVREWEKQYTQVFEAQHRNNLSEIIAEYNSNKGQKFVRDSEGNILDEAYLRMQEKINQENSAYEQSLAKMQEDKDKMGNAILLMNLPVLLGSYFTQFGKLFSNGFKTARKSYNILGKPGEYVAGSTTHSLPYHVTKNALSEGLEEFSQGIATKTATNYYTTDVNNFYKAKTDREAEKETLNWAKSFGEGLVQNIGDGNAWEEFLIGAMTSAMGIPRFRSTTNNEGKFQSPITIYNEAYRDWKEGKETVEREAKLVEYMNNVFKNSDTKTYYQGLIRHNKYQNDMNIAAQEGKEFEFKNAEHAQLVSDIAMFDEAGKLGDLKAFINEAAGTSKTDLESVVTETTKKTEEGKLVGPFAQYAALDDSGNIIANFGSQEDTDNMADQITKNKNDILSTIKQYQEIKDGLIEDYGDKLTEDQLQELTWMKSQIGNWSERATAMSGEVKSAIGNVIGNLDSFLRFNQQVRDFEGQSHADLSDRYKQADKNVRAIEGAINTLNMVKSHDDETLAYILATNPKFVDGLVKEINEVDETVLSADKKEDITTKLNDIVKLGNVSKTYNAKLKEYLENPQKQAEDHAKADEQAAQQETKKKSDDLKSSLNAAQNLQEFRGIIDSQDDIENRDKVLKELEDEGSEMAKNYRETSQYNNEVRRVLNESDAEPQVKQDAMKLFQDQFNNSDNLEYLANPNSIYINNENTFDEESEGDVELSATRFQNAQYELQKAMSKVNNDNKFKNRFSPEYKKPVEKREGTVRGDDRTTTGDSGTSTTSTVDTSTLPTTEIPVGNITQEMVAEENKKASEKVETPQRPNRDTVNQFYRPAIPELHIEASKEGDFRPFVDVVAEREKGVDFSDIYNYLRDSGAFEYLNQGKLHVGDEIGFMIDPKFEERVKDKEWHKAPTIFMINKKDDQVVGSLDESDYSASRYEGLKGLEEKIRGEYATRENKTGKFVATPTTKVSKIMVGRIPYSNQERNLKDIPNVIGAEKKPIFGIIRNGKLVTNTDKVSANDIIYPMDMSNEGRLYLLIPNGAGKYSPAAIRVKHFNKEEFNLDDVNVASTPIGKDIKEGITKLANAISQDDVSLAMKDLAQDLYLQDVMVSHFTSRTGKGIVISKKVKKPDGTYEKVTINGKEQIKEDKYDIYFSNFGKSTVIDGLEFVLSEDVAKEVNNDERLQRTIRNPEDIYNEILGHLIKFNLPLQVSTGRINEAAYNNKIINSGILTSNITDASVRSTWFTTDYFDNEGNLHQAISPASVAPQPKRKIETPVGGTEGAIAGTRIVSVFSYKPYYVDLKTNTIRDDQGRTIEITDSNRILVDLAWAQDNFGDSTNSSMMVDNKVLTPDGKVLDRSKQTYLSGQEAQDVKDTIAGRTKERENRVAKSNEVVSEIYENQKRVDKTRTDGKFYYVLEDDGQYHEYSRVHSRLGSNWVESPKQTKALKDIEVQLSRLVMASPTGYNNYLDTTGKRFKVDLSAFHNKMGIKDRQAILNTIRDKMSGTDDSSAVDSIVRQYFTIKDVSKIARPSNMSENAFIDLITSLNKIKSNMELMGERFLTDNIVLFQKYPDGTRVAGEADILSIDKDGNFRIYDVETRRYSFYDFTDRHGHKVNYFTTPSATQRMSAKDYYTLQLSAYKNLFESQYSVPVTKLAVIPFVLSYDKENVSAVQSEKGISIAYNPAVNVPLVGNVKVDKPVEAPATPAQAQTVLPIFEASLETQNPIEDLTPEHKSTDKDKVGYFELDGKLHKGYITPLTTINGVELHLTKVPNITKGFGKDTAHVASNSYYAVFPNGKTFLFLNNPVQGGKTQEEVEKAIKAALEGNKQRVKDLSSEKTILFDPNAVPTVSATPITTIETPATINQSTTQTGAAYTAQKEQAINNKKTSRIRHKLRAVDNERAVWNQEKELNWLSRVLPQLSENDRVKVVKGLIKVGRQGTLAWGQFDKGVITLSDIAAEGTAYHEAFHAVFNLLLDQSERQALYDEARRIYGEKDNLSLEEDMAEGFREYVMTRQNRGLGRRILDFFKELFTKVTNWNNFRPSLISYYQRINEGKYADSNFKVPTISELRGAAPNTITFNSLNESIRENLTRKGWTAEKFDSISQDERDQAVKCMAF